MQICVPVPVPERRSASQTPPSVRRPRRIGALGVIDNSKPRFDVLVRSAIAELSGSGFGHEDSHYVHKPSPTRPATDGEIERLGSGTVAVIIGSGD